ncbi:MAG TPA: beta-ketoacyl synthase chain length factor [Flavobacteriales bacterium]|nr:beta-ketoacyl synthase chain length factor [Flavobacteriales bacterium]
MHDANGALLSPLPFMRSTHNTMAGQIALMLRCDGPNITHAQGLDGFHAALVEAELMLHEKPEWNILVIALDERTALLERIAGALDPAINVGAGGEAFMLSGIDNGNAVARITWATDTDSARMMRHTNLALHGSLIAQQLGDAIAAGFTQPMRIGSSESSLTDLLISPC